MPRKMPGASQPDKGDTGEEDRQNESKVKSPRYKCE